MSLFREHQTASYHSGAMASDVNKAGVARVKGVQAIKASRPYRFGDIEA